MGTDHQHTAPNMVPAAPAAVDVEAWRRRLRDETLANYHFEMGQAIRREGNPDAAADHFRQAVNILPAFAEAHFRLVQVLKDLGRNADAEEAHRRALAVDSRYEADARFRIGRGHHWNGKHPEAEGTLRAVLAEHPDHTEARIYLALALVEQQRFDEAEEVFGGAPGDPPDRGELASDYLRSCRPLISSGRWRLARAFVSRAAALDPRLPLLSLYEALVRLALDGGDEARKSFPVERPADSATALRIAQDLHLAASNLFHADRFEDAIWLLRRAIECSETFAEGHILLGSILTRQRRFDEALSELRLGLKHGPSLSWGHGAYGLALQAQGQLEAGVDAARQGLALEPSSLSGRSTFARTLQNVGRFDEAAAIYRAAIADTPKGSHTSAWLHGSLGLTLLGARQFDAAEAAFREGLGCDIVGTPFPSVLTSNLGLVLHANGRLPEAVAAYLEAAAMPRADSRVQTNHGLALQIQGQTDAAAAVHHKIIDRDPLYSPAWINLGLALHELGRQDEAMSSFRSALESGREVLLFEAKLRPWADDVLRTSFRTLGVEFPA